MKDRKGFYYSNRKDFSFMYRSFFLGIVIKALALLFRITIQFNVLDIISFTMILTEIYLQLRDFW